MVESCFDNRQLLPGNRSKLTQTDEDKALENVQLMDGNEEVLAMDECSSHVGEEGVHATPLFQSGLDVSVRQPEVLRSGGKVEATSAHLSSSNDPDREEQCSTTSTSTAGLSSTTVVDNKKERERFMMFTQVLMK